MKRPNLALLALLSLAGIPGITGCSPRDDAGKFLANGDRFFDQRQFEKAKIEYANVLRAQPTNAHAVMRLGKILMAQGQVQEAAPMIVWSRKQFPNDLELRSQLLEILALGMRAGTNRAWLRAEVEDLLQRDPAHEQGVLLLPVLAETTEELGAVATRLDRMRREVGERPVFHLAMADVHARRGQTNQIEGELRAAEALDGRHVKVHSAMAVFLFGRGQKSEAERHLRLASELAPPHSPTRESWARWLIQRGRLPEAQTVLEEVTGAAPERLGGWVGLAEIALLRKDLVQAERVMARAVGLAPRDPGVLGVLARLRTAQGNPDAAVQILEEVVQRFPRAAGVHYQLARAQLESRNAVRAIASLERSLQLEPGAIEPALLLAELNLGRGEAYRAAQALRGMVRIRPDLESPYLLLIRAEQAIGRTAEALNLAQEAARRFPSNMNLALEEGIVLRKLGQITNARASFQRALTLSTNSILAVEQLIALDTEKRDFASAHRLLDTAAATNPRDPLIWLLRSEVQRVEGNLQLADQSLHRTLEFDPDNLTAYFALARNAIQSGRQKEAVAQLEEVIKRDPRDLRALLMLGTLRSEMGDLREARAAYMRALEIRPDQPVMLNNLAYLVGLQLADLDEGHRLALRAREASPRNPAVADTLGWIEFLRGNYPEALRLLQEAAALLGTNPEIQYHLGMSQYMMGHEAQALAALRQAVQTPREYMGIAQAREALKILEQGSAKPDASVVASLEERQRKSPSDLVVLLHLGAAYEASGKADQARGMYEAALKVNPRSVTVLSRLANFLAPPDRDPKKALELAHKAHSLAPNDADVAATLGRLALRAGDSAWAYALMQEASPRIGERPDLAHDLAWAAFSQGAIREAVQAMTSAVQSAGEDERRSAAREFVELLESSQQPETIEARGPRIEEALRRAPDSGPALLAHAVLAAQRGQVAESRRSLEALLIRFPGCHPAARRLAILLGDQAGSADAAKALELGTRVRPLYPKDAELDAALGKAASLAGDFNFSELLLSEAIRSRPKDAALHYSLGVTYQGLRRLADARRSLEKALELQPAGTFASDARKRLQALVSP